MKRHTGIIAVLSIAATAALTGCGSDADSADGADGRLTATGPIDIWYSNNEHEVAWAKQAVEAWNTTHPDELVTAQEIPAGKSSEEVIGASIAAGNTPCLVYNTAPAAVPDFETQGGLVDLSSFPDGAAYIEARTGAASSQFTSAEGYFQMPWKSNPVVIFYNKDLFAAADLDPEAPKTATYEEFLATSRAIVDSGAADYAIYPAPSSEFYQSWFDFYPFFAAESGGMQLVEDGTAAFAGEAGVAVADLWRQMYEEGLAGAEPFLGDSFVEGKAAMSLAGPWAVAYYGDQVNWGTTTIPTSAGTAAGEGATFDDAKNIGMYTACENQKTAWEFLKFTTSVEQDGTLLEMTGQMPLRADLATTYPEFFAEKPEYAAWATLKTVAVPNVPNSTEVWQTFRDSWTNSVIFGKADVAPALTTTADTINTLVQD